MVQSWNSSGVRGFLKILCSRKERQKLLPILSFPSVADIPFSALKRCGAKAVIFDKDNTLTAPYSFSMDKQTEETVRRCQRLFGYDNVVIFSNSAGSDDDRGYLHAQTIEEELKIRVIRHHLKKPDGLLEAVSLWPSVQPSEVMMVGDRYLTDIYGGNQHGMLTVCVDIITETNDNKGAIFARRLERFLLRCCACEHLKPLFHPIAVRFFDCPH
ncbi:hypothetical protein WA538_000152, partial [Blastocystis sp. DL]